jgi:hypothetical protein
MSDTPPDWVLIEAARRSGWVRPREALSCSHFTSNGVTRALCDMIAKHEQPPIDRKVLCAREAWRLYDPDVSSIHSTEQIGIRAIELWEEGFGA